MNLAMIRIALLGSRSAWGRLAGIAIGVAAGTAMFLILLGAYNGLERREDRGSTISDLRIGEASSVGSLNANNALFAPVSDYVNGERIDHFEIAVTADTTMVMPGLSTLPGPGEYLASPALKRLIDSMPADQLGDRYGTSIGTLPNSLLESPDTLMVIVGGSEEELRALPSASIVTDFFDVSTSNYLGYQIIVIIGAIGMFFPVLLFISIVTQLGAVQRQERFAALRLIGASSQTVSWFAAVETAITSSIGAIVGVGIALAFRPIAAEAKVDGKRFFVDDFAVGTTTIVVAVIGMVVISTLAASFKIRRTGVSPINTVRDIRETRPSVIRTIPLVAGLAMVVAASLLVRSYDAGGTGILLLFVGGFILLLVGIVLIGPYLTFWLSRLLCRVSGSAATLIAGRRISATPSATFRSVSGLVVAVFIVTVFAGAASAVADDPAPKEGPGMMPSHMLMTMTGSQNPDPLISALDQTDGVTATVVAWINPDAPRQGGFNVVVTREDAALLGFTDVPDSAYVSFSFPSYAQNEQGDPAELSPATVDDPSKLLPQALFVVTDGSDAAIERARTKMLNAGSDNAALSRAEMVDSSSNEDIEELKVLAYLGAILSIVIAGCSLAIATACTMLDRKRVLGLMRLMGMPEGNLQKIVAIEAAVPLLAVLGMVIALGFGIAWCIVEGTSSYSIGVPDRYYFMSITFGLLLALATIAATFGLIRRNTLVTVTRFE
ncbi:hypothetical protein BH09CHL1_BH09CHL1_13320 [soil metagenome]